MYGKCNSHTVTRNAEKSSIIIYYCFLRTFPCQYHTHLIPIFGRVHTWLKKVRKWLVAEFLIYIFYRRENGIEREIMRVNFYSKIDVLFRIFSFSCCVSCTACHGVLVMFSPKFKCVQFHNIWPV